MKKLLNFKNGGGTIQVAFNEADESPVEMLICSEIGKDPWSGNGISAVDIKSALDAVQPRGRAINFLTNSPGGVVSEGLAIRNLLSQWPGKITNTIIGIAASTASWMIPADETRAYKSSQMFIHRAWGAVVGNADDLRDAINFLEKTDGQIADIYAEQTGRRAETMMRLMSNETLLTGQEALDNGFVDVLIEGDAKNQFSNEQLSEMKNKLAALNTLRRSEQGATNNKPRKENVVMNKEQMLALLNKWGVKNIPADATDAQLVELVNAGKPAEPAPAAPAVANLDDHPLIKKLQAQAALQRRNSIRNRVQSAVSAGRIAANEIDSWVTQAESATDEADGGNPILTMLDKLPAVQPGVPSLSATPTLEAGDESFANVQKFILANSTGFGRNFLGAKAQNEITPSVLKEIGSRSLIAANTIKKHKNMLTEMFNANAIDTDLQRQVILQDMLEAYALQLAPLQAFSVVYQNVPLQGNDAVVVPYFPLQTNAAVSFVKGTGYTTTRDWTQNSRKVTVGGDGDSTTSGSNATAGTAKDRLFLQINFTSYDMARQPYLNVMKLAQQSANKLGIDIFTAIASRVIVAGNFGAAVKTVAAPVFSADDIADLAEYATTAQWPEIGRSLVLANTYKTPLLKDNTFKQYLSYGSTDPIRKAMIQEAYGFQDMYFVPALTNYLATNTSGWINHQSAVLVAFAPIMPTPEVRALLTTYDIAVEPRSGAVLEYRKFGNVTTDLTQEVIESSFGAAKGVDAALKIIKSA